MDTDLIDEKAFMVVYKWQGLIYTVRDAGGNTSIFNSDEADDVVSKLLSAAVDNETDAFKLEIPIPERWVEWWKH